MRLGELARAVSDEDDWKRLCPGPALVFLSSPKESGRVKSADVDAVEWLARTTRADTGPQDEESLYETHVDENPLGRASKSLSIMARSEVVFLKRAPNSRMVTVGKDKSNDVVLENNTVSRRHALFTVTSSGWTLSDRGSANGTFVNGDALLPNMTTPITNGMRIDFGFEVVAHFYTPEGLLELITALRVQAR